MLYLILGLAVVAGILLKITLSQAKNSGKVEVANQTQEKAIQDVKTDTVIRDRLNHDPALHDSVQHRFERD